MVNGAALASRVRRDATHGGQSSTIAWQALHVTCTSCVSHGVSQSAQRPMIVSVAMAVVAVVAEVAVVAVVAVVAAAAGAAAPSVPPPATARRRSNTNILPCGGGSR